MPIVKASTKEPPFEIDLFKFGERDIKMALHRIGDKGEVHITFTNPARGVGLEFTKPADIDRLIELLNDGKRQMKNYEESKNQIPIAWHGDTSKPCG